MQSLFMMRKVLGMPWSPPDWGDLSEAHVCAHELLGCINGEELKWGNAGFFKKPFFIHCCWFCRAKLYFYPPVATWTYISKGYWNLLWHSGSRRAWRGTPFSDSFLLLLWDDVIAYSLFFLFSCDSATQSSLECGIHLLHWYCWNLLKGDFVTKT